MKVFLGGTYKDNWRQDLTKWIVCSYNDPTIIEFNPQDSTTAMPQVIKEIKLKQECGIILHLFTNKTKGFSEIVSATIDVMNNPGQTIISVIHEEGLSREQTVSLTEFAIFAQMKGSKVIVGGDRDSIIKEVALMINNKADHTKVDLLDNWR